MLDYAYVKITTGIYKNRIGRYVRKSQDLKKAVVSFNYQIDIIPYSNFIKVPFTSLTNEITREDLTTRYYDIVQSLKKIDIKADRNIKKYSSEHIDFITEGDLIRSLLLNINDVNNLNSLQKENNVIVISSYKDNLWCNDFLLDLEQRTFNIAVIDHDFYKANLDYITKANNFIFILSNDSLTSNWLKDEYSFIKENMNMESTLLTVSIDTSILPKYIKENYYLGEMFSKEYNQGLNAIIDKLNKYLT